MTKNRPDYIRIRCILHTHADLSKTSWCGEELSGLQSQYWAFQNIDDAVYSVQRGSLSIPCPDCLKKIYEVLGK